jgi:flagellar biosynthesis/type III secretory pathway protein FliH
MGYVALFVTEDVNVATAARVLPAEELRALADGRELLLALQSQRESDGVRVAVASDRARDAGYAEGFAAGCAAARKQLAQAQLELELAAQRERSILRRQTEASVATLALEVVRKLAGEIDAAELVAALARQAVRQLLDDEPVTLVVHPQMAERVRAQADAGPQDAHGPAVAVQEDPTLAPLDCRLVTRSGTTLAGLDVQLRRLEAAWDAVEAR